VAIVKSDVRTLKIVDNNTVQLDQVAVSNTFKIKLAFYIDGDASTDVNTVATVNVTSFSGSSWTAPDDYTVTKPDANTIQIVHNVGINPYTFSVLDTTASPNVYIVPSGLGVNLNIVDSNTIIISGCSGISNSFKINLGFSS